MSRVVSFETNAYGEPVGRTRSGQEYSQDPYILRQRNEARSINKNAVVLNPELAARPPLIGEDRQYGWTTNDTSFYQTPEEKANAKQQKSYETPLFGNRNWTAADAGTSGVFGKQRIWGGKKTKRKRSCRTKKSRRHRKK